MQISSPIINHYTNQILIADDITRYFYDVADKIEEDWIQLANKLDVSAKIDTKSIINSCKQNFDRADDFLCQWKDEYGSRATLRRLISALNAINRVDIADVIGM